MGVTISGVSTVVIDIEGTTSSTWFVYNHLYPYSRERFAKALALRDSDPEIARAVEQISELIHVDEPTDAEILDALNGWLDNDEKITPLKSLQGRIWEEGFARGELTAHFFPDVIPALKRWDEQGLRLAVFSSGSLRAQRAWFAHSESGDLLPLFSAHFDTETAGPKRVEASYLAIAGELEVAPRQLVFLSDLDAELDAAAAAGWHAVGVRRPGEQHFERGVGPHPHVSSFAELTLELADD